MPPRSENRKELVESVKVDTPLEENGRFRAGEQLLVSLTGQRCD